MEPYDNLICFSKEVEDDWINNPGTIKILRENMRESLRKIEEKELEKYGDTNPFGSAPV